MTKKVLIPAEKDGNSFFDGITENSGWQFDYGHLYSDITGYAVLLIHWPEQLFKWQEPTKAQLEELAGLFTVWKQTLNIVYVVHNEKRHWGMTANFEQLYQLVLNNCDTMVHFGEYSLKKYQKSYPDIHHELLSHPLYSLSFDLVDKKLARKQLGLKEDKKIMLVPGNVRNKAERSLITKAFDKLPLNNKLLLSQNMFYKQTSIEFPGRYALKKIVDIKRIVEYFYNQEYKTTYKLGYGFVDTQKLSLMTSAADVIMVPRLDALNSGIVFWAMTFNKVVIGPAIGNMKEVLEAAKLPVFNPQNLQSVEKALRRGFQLQEDQYKYPINVLMKHNPKVLAEQWDAFLNGVLLKGKNLTRGA
ncbi:glycosyltransferase [Xanthomarina gelatinilytica]|uniref:glycosyltransferase n=1 Tax=Xanthomarina gelatinilytica TaxID=1137281 RepID=UPI003AA9474A